MSTKQIEVHRRADTGRFTTERDVKRNPAKTVTEHYRVPVTPKPPAGGKKGR